MKKINYFLIGIKGSGMSSLALILNDLGYNVSGSDINEYTFTQKKLENAGIKIFPFNSNNIKKDMVVIAGNSFSDDQPEIKKARELNDVFMRYHEFLSKFIKKYVSIGIAGAHGKTSTTSLLAHIFSQFDKTSYLIGDGSGKGVQNSKFFIFEADEYHRRFLSYYPDYLVITNIDFDHPDYYKNINDVFNAFQSEVNQTSKAIIACGEDPYLLKLNANIPIYYYGISDCNDFLAYNIKYTTEGTEFDVNYKNKKIGHFKTKLFGKHNVLNCLAAISMGYIENIPYSNIYNSILTFKGAKRRFDQVKINNVIIIDDYAHHPSEINATLNATKQKYPNKKIVVVFQPHTYSRTKAYLNDFADVLSKADEVYITPIFGSARESDGSISSKDLVSKIKNSNLLTMNNINELLKNKDDDVVLFMGAGDIQKYENAYEKFLKNI